MDKLWFPRLISSGMVLQRGCQTTLPGKSIANDCIKIHFINQEYQIEANDQGDFIITLDELEAGGPYQLLIESQAYGTSCFEDVYVGDVYIGSGQSNMELPISRVRWYYDIDWTRFNNTHMRYFKVEENPNFSEMQLDHNSGHWTEFSVDSIQSISALGVFFLERLYQKLEIPLGFIQVALGGSPIQAWLPQHLIDDEDDKIYQEFKDDGKRKLRQEQDLLAEVAWNKALDQCDQGYKQQWHLCSDFSSWPLTDIPCHFKDLFGSDYIGAVWFAKKIHLNADQIEESWMLDLGTIVDADEVYFNGVKIGQTDYRYPPRRYSVPRDLLSVGDNTLLIRVKIFQGQGRFTPDKDYALKSDHMRIPLNKSWNYHVGGRVEIKPSQEFMSWKPTVLHNGMLGPCFQYNIKGFIWYQGESNTERPQKYEGYLRAFTHYLRQQFRQEKLPIAIIQLVNFEVDLNPKDFGWPEVREAQRKVVEQEDLGLIVGIDAGEHNDLHPLNKALLAERTAGYFEEVIYQSDIHGQSPKWIQLREDVEGLEWICEFDTHGLAFDTRHECVDGFVAIDTKGHSYPLEARVEGRSVRLRRPQISENTNVTYIEIRYAFENNPTGRLLYDEAGLPVSPLIIVI